MEWFTSFFPDQHFLSYSTNVYAALAILLTGLICSSIGGLVVGNRMAFFSDALAHCAFAGMGIGLAVCLALHLPDDLWRESVLFAMIGFGIAFGLLITFVREQTGLANDTVIGVFFAFAIGLGAVVSGLVAQRRRVPSIESFIFGNPLGVQPLEIALMFLLLVITILFLLRYYNDLILTSVHPSLALSRRVPVRLLRYLLVTLVAVLVNLCLLVVGVLLINGLLIVPAAAASNLSRNLRQQFWWTVGITLTCGLGGQVLSWELSERHDLRIGIGGTIIVLCSLVFFASMLVVGFRRYSRSTAS